MILIVIGTRPEIIKMSPVIRECNHQGLEYSVVHTGQHYSYAMDRIFFEQLDISLPKYSLDVGSGTHGAQTAAILTGIENILQKNPVHIVGIMLAGMNHREIKTLIGTFPDNRRHFDNFRARAEDYENHEPL